MKLTIKKIAVSAFCLLSINAMARTEGIIKVYKTLDSTLTVVGGDEVKTKATSYLIFEYDATGTTITNQKQISFGKDKDTGLWKSTTEPDYTPKVADGAKDVRYRYFYDGTSADGDGMAYLAFGPTKLVAVGVNADKSKIESLTASSLKGEAFEYEKGASKNENLIATTKYSWRLDSGITKEANNYLGTKITHAEVGEMPNFAAVVSYIEDVKLAKYTK